MNYPFYWSGTTHASMAGGGNAAYVAFGEALGWMLDPFGTYHLLDVHGAGSQRSDPKAGDPADFPYGHGPQGDVIRIKNYVRLVRDAEVTGASEGTSMVLPQRPTLYQNYPNPFNPSTTIRYTLPFRSAVSLTVFNTLGQQVATLAVGVKDSGDHDVLFDAGGFPSGIYLCRLTIGDFVQTRKMVLVM